MGLFDEIALGDGTRCDRGTIGPCPDAVRSRRGCPCSDEPVRSRRLETTSGEGTRKVAAGGGVSGLGLLRWWCGEIPSGAPGREEEDEEGSFIGEVGERGGFRERPPTRAETEGVSVVW